MPRLALVSNELPPYRVPFFRKLGRIPGVRLHVIFCTAREPNRLWDLPDLDFSHTFLRECFITVHGRYIHNNVDVISCLRRFAPDVVITGGFNPTHLYAFGYARARGLVHIPMTDGTNISEQSLSSFHKRVRRFVYARSRAFVCASAGGKKLFQSYGVPAERCFKSCLCVDNDAFFPGVQPHEKRFDMIFCGRIEAVKNPLFAFNVALETAKQMQRKIRILFVGAGTLEQEVRRAAWLHPEYVEAEFRGFAAHGELPLLYRSARLFLFPTRWDPWGVVANEACASGLPVLVSPHAGVAGELVHDGENGFVCELDVQRWTERAVLLLTRQDIWRDFSRRSLALVKDYTYDRAAEGLLEACRFSLASARA